MTSLLLLMVLGARPFVHSWTRALLYSWKLVYDVEQVRRKTSISESSGDHLVAPLRAWCVRNLRGFDGRMFDRLAWSLGDDESKDIVVWSKRDT